MKSLLKPVVAAGLLLTAGAPLVEAPAAAQAVKGIGIVDINAVVAQSKAKKAADEQRPVHFKAQIDAANARAEQINAQLEPMKTKLDADRQAANPDQASLAQQLQAIEEIGQKGQMEVDRMLLPVDFSREYVSEQILGQLNTAINNAVAKKNVSLVLRPGQVVYAADGYDMTADVVAELDALLPVAQLVPPQGWLPLSIRQELAARQAAQGLDPNAAAAPAAPAAPVAGQAPEGR